MLLAVYLPVPVLPQVCPTAGSGSTQFCLAPSMGPTGGGTAIGVYGLQLSSSWSMLCPSAAAAWSCNFVLGLTDRYSAPTAATPSDCSVGRIWCPSPTVSQPGDYLVFVTATLTAPSGAPSITTFPSVGSLPVFGYYGGSLHGPLRRVFSAAAHPSEAQSSPLGEAAPPSQAPALSHTLTLPMCQTAH